MRQVYNPGLPFPRNCRRGNIFERNSWTHGTADDTMGYDSLPEEGDNMMRGNAVLVFCVLVAPLLGWTGSTAGAAPTFEWDHLYDGGAFSADVGVKVTTDASGNLIIAGESTDLVDGADILILKLERETGDTLWSRRFSADDGNAMGVGGMVWDGQGNLLIGGTRFGCFG